MRLGDRRYFLLSPSKCCTNAVAMVQKLCFLCLPYYALFAFPLEKYISHQNSLVVYYLLFKSLFAIGHLACSRIHFTYIILFMTQYKVVLLITFIYRVTSLVIPDVVYHSHEYLIIRDKSKILLLLQLFCGLLNHEQNGALSAVVRLECVCVQVYACDDVSVSHQPDSDEL